MVMSYSLLRSRLEKEQERLLQEIKEFDTEQQVAFGKQANGRLAEIAHTLQKFEDGTYGLCDGCGSPIDPARLEALPEASSCIKCKAGGKNG